MSEDFFRKLYANQGSLIKKMMPKDGVQKEVFKVDKPGFMSFNDFVYRKKKNS